MPNKKIFIIAGEVSGDMIGAQIMRQMHKTEFVGIGGTEMIGCGLQSLFPMSDLSVMGVVEVIMHGRTLARRIHQTVDAIIDSRPDVVLTIDSPGFARSVIRALRKKSNGRELIANGLQFHHVVAPQVWAWRPGRAKKYARMFDKLYAFFDFEVPYFTKYGLDTVAIGHPVAERLKDFAKAESGNRQEKIITFIPGSRMSEVKRLMPIFRRVANMIGSWGVGYRFAIPVVETTKEYVETAVRDWPVRPEIVPSDARYDLYRCTHVAIAASGTVSVELAMMHVPAIIVYKMNAITTWLVRQVIRVRWVSLVNILLNRSVYPEYLGSAATADNIFNELKRIILPANRTKMIDELKQADDLWLRPEGTASKLVAKEICD